MRILIATRKAALGSSHYVGALLQGLACRDHQCDLMLRGGPSEAHLRSLSHRRWPLSPWKPLARLQAGAMLVRARPDVANVIITSATIPVLRACLQAGVPVVATLLMRTRLERFASDLEQCAAIVVLNRSNLEFYRQQYPSLAPKMHLSAKLVDRQRFRAGERREADEFRLACLGRLSQTKGERVVQTLEAAWSVREDIPGVSVTVVGSGTRLRHVRQLAARMNLQARRRFVTVCGGVARPEEIIRNMDVVAAAGFSAIEALACHCQVIGMGFKGLGGLVTADTFGAALATNFGDSTAREPATPEAIAAEIKLAYARRMERLDWIEQAFTGVLNPAVVLDDLEQLLQIAARTGES